MKKWEFVGGAAVTVAQSFFFDGDGDSRTVHRLRS